MIQTNKYISKPSSFILKSEHQLIKFDYDDIVYLQADGNYSIIYLKDHTKYIIYLALINFNLTWTGGGG